MTKTPKFYGLHWLLVIFLVVLIRPVLANDSLVILGDSLSAGYGVAKNQTWVSLLQQRWQQAHPNLTIINASISGETTQGALNRLDNILAEHQPAAIFVELGGNDGLRGFDLSQLRQRINQIIDAAQQQGVSVALSEVQLPPNYGPRFAEMFNQTYQQIADQQGITLVPFFMKPLVGKVGMIQDDGIHPTAKAQPLIADFLEPYLLDLVKQESKQ
ncbi:arylesterase [Idiomarina tyrosinivorans]|uniref:Arylesterase n=1 Tax=Idiomarina tyrosinivorans TaxID=1445662 RepID=A0A432ZM13_9GAMM|nr:arylesterase [Idiomarina tyrosinivorans]